MTNLFLQNRGEKRPEITNFLSLVTIYRPVFFCGCQSGHKSLFLGVDHDKEDDNNDNYDNDDDNYYNIGKLRMKKQKNVIPHWKLCFLHLEYVDDNGYYDDDDNNNKNDDYDEDFDDYK